MPEGDFRRALQEAGNCRAPWGGKTAGGLALCLGTSMQMAPARELPCEAGRMVIVNLQPTEYDADCYLNVRARIDDVLHGLMRELGLRIPVYERWETFHLHHQVSVKHKTAAGEDGECAFHVTYRLSVGESTLLHDAPSGYLSWVTLRLPPALGGGGVVMASQPFTHSARAVVRRPSHACSTCTPTTGGADADAGAASGL